MGSNLSILVSHPTGNANVRALIAGLHNRSLLHSYWTTLSVGRRFELLGALHSGLNQELARRSYEEVPKEKIVTKPTLELLRQISKRFGFGWITRHGDGIASTDAVYQNLDQAVAKFVLKSASHQGITGVYAYEDGAGHTFSAANRIGLDAIYELPIGYYREFHRIIAEQSSKFPEWASTVNSLRDPQEKLDRKDLELKLASRVYVASSFTKKSLNSAPSKPKEIFVVPYGAPPPRVESPASREKNEPIKLIFAGHLNLRKGLPDLIRSTELFDFDWHLIIAGTLPQSPPKALTDFLANPRVQWVGHVPHSKLLKYMAESHAFVFPSVFEGFGLVIYEAMSCGLPVVTTPHTAGPDIIEHGHNGFILPINDSTAIASTLGRLHADEHYRKSVGVNALSAAKARGWELYRSEVANTLENSVVV